MRNVVYVRKAKIILFFIPIIVVIGGALAFQVQNCNVYCATFLTGGQGITCSKTIYKTTSDPITAIRCQAGPGMKLSLEQELYQQVVIKQQLRVLRPFIQ